MNLAMCKLPSNMKISSHKMWQASLLCLKPLQIQNLKRKKWRDMTYYIPHMKKWGGHVPRVPHQIPPMQLEIWWIRVVCLVVKLVTRLPGWLRNLRKVKNIHCFGFHRKKVYKSNGLKQFHDKSGNWINVIKYVQSTSKTMIFKLFLQIRSIGDE